MNIQKMSKNEIKAMQICEEQVKILKLPMKLVDAKYIANDRKIVFRFSSENRVDFRDLVRIVKDKLHIKVELHQVGPRDNAMQMGGIPHCGKRELCCKQFGCYPKITDEMLEAQGIKPTPKMYGYCGRLKCCYAYEYFADGTLTDNRPETCSKCTSAALCPGHAKEKIDTPVFKAPKRHIFLIRHPQTTVTDPTIYADGHTDAELSDEGVEQCTRILNYLKSQNISAIITSPLKRAATLAHFLGEQLNLKPTMDEGLKELNVGIWRGMREADIKEKHPKLWDAWIHKPEITQIPEGESLSETQKRMVRAINNGIKTQTGNIAFASHNISILLYLVYLDGLPIKKTWEYLENNPISLGQIIKIELPEGRIVERTDTSEVAEEIE